MPPVAKPKIHVPGHSPSSPQKSDDSSKRAPNGLGAAGKAFWREVLEEYDLNVVDLPLLRLACECLDRIDQLKAQLKQDGLMVGSNRVSPLLKQIREESASYRMLRRELPIQVNIPQRKGTPVNTRPAYGSTGEIRKQAGLE